MKLVGLQGVSQKETTAVTAASRSEFLKVMKGTALTAAGEDGAINVWIDDAGCYRAEFMQYRSIISSVVFDGSDVKKAKDDLRSWLKDWYPRMRRA